jgi:hypothetical protein
MSRRLRIWRLGMAALTSVLLLGSCGSRSDGVTNPASPAVADASAESAETPKSKAPDAESAEQFVRRWVEVDRHMQNTGEMDRYLSISSGCRPCTQVAERVAQMYANGGWVRTKGWTILDLKDVSTEVGRVAFDLRVRSAPTRFRETRSGEVQRYPGGVVVMRLRLTNKEPWRLVRLTQIPS